MGEYVCKIITANKEQYPGLFEKIVTGKTMLEAVAEVREVLVSEMGVPRNEITDDLKYEMGQLGRKPEELVSIQVKPKKWATKHHWIFGRVEYWKSNGERVRDCTDELRERLGRNFDAVEFNIGIFRYEDIVLLSDILKDAALRMESLLPEIKINPSPDEVKYD